MNSRCCFHLFISVFLCALISCSCAICEEADGADALVARGRDLYDSGDFRGCIELLTGVINSNTNDKEALGLRGLCEYRVGEYDNSFYDLKTAIDLDGSDAETQFATGKACVYTKRTLVMCNAYFAAAVALDEKYIDEYFKFSARPTASNYDKARMTTVLNSAKNNFVESSVPDLANSFFSLYDCDASLKTFNRVSAAYYSSAVNFGAGRAKVCLGNFVGAVEDISRALEDDKQSAYYYLRSFAHAGAGKCAEAEKDMRTAIKMVAELGGVFGAADLEIPWGACLSGAPCNDDFLRLSILGITDINKYDVDETTLYFNIGLCHVKTGAALAATNYLTKFIKNMSTRRFSSPAVEEIISKIVAEGQAGSGAVQNSQVPLKSETGATKTTEEPACPFYDICVTLADDALEHSNFDEAAAFLKQAVIFGNEKEKEEASDKLLSLEKRRGIGSANAPEISEAEVKKHVSAGRACMIRHSKQCAMDSFNYALTLSPKDPGALKGMADFYMMEGNFRIASKYINSILSSNPDDASSIFRQSLAYYNMADFQTAEGLVLKSIALDKKYMAGFFKTMLKTLFTGDPYIRYRDFGGPSLNIKRDLFSDYYNSGLHNMHYDNYKKAVFYFDKALAVNNGDKALISWIYYNRALAYAAQGKLQEAMQDLTSAINEENKAAYYRERGSVKSLSGQCEGAKSDYEEYLTLRETSAPPEWFMDFTLAICYMGTDDAVNAKEYLERSYSAMPAADPQLRAAIEQATASAN